MLAATAPRSVPALRSPQAAGPITFVLGLAFILLGTGCAQLDAARPEAFVAPEGWSTAATAAAGQTAATRTNSASASAPAATPNFTPAPWPAGDDAVLADLLARLERDNLELKGAAARLAASRAVAEHAAALHRPWLDGGLDLARQRVPRSNFRDSDGQRHRVPPYRESRYDAQFVLGYEVDLFGRLAQLQAGAEAAQAAQAADLEALRLRLRLETRFAYLDLRHAESQQEESAAAAMLLRQRLEHLAARHSAGLVGRDALRPAQDALAAVERQAAAERAERHLAHSRLAVLLGQAPAELVVAPAPPAAKPATPGQTPAELPAAVIARRPDIAAAWNAALAAAHERERVRLERWPRLTLTASGGVLSDRLGDWLRRDAVGWLAGLALQGPILDGGRHAARHDAARAEAEAAHAHYRQQVVAALGEVESTLLRLEAARQQDDSLTQQRARRAGHLADTQASARAGRSDALALIDAELELLAARREQHAGRHALQVRWHEARHSLGY